MIGEYELAVNDYSKLISQEVRNPEVFFQRGTISEILGNYLEAVDDFCTAIEINPKDDTYYFSRGTSYFKLNELERAISDFTTAISLDDQQPDSYFYRGFAYERSLNFENAKIDFEKALLLDRTGECVFHKALISSKLATTPEDHVQVIEEYGEAITLLTPEKPDYSRCFFWRAMEHDILGQYEQAIEDFAEAAKLMGTNNTFVPTVLVEKGITYKKLDMHEKALNEWKAAASLQSCTLRDLFKEFKIPEENLPADYVDESFEKSSSPKIRATIRSPGTARNIRSSSIGTHRKTISESASTEFPKVANNEKAKEPESPKAKELQYEHRASTARYSRKIEKPAKKKLPKFLSFFFK